MSAAPEMIDVAMKKKSPKRALKTTVTKTARKKLKELATGRYFAHEPVRQNKIVMNTNNKFLVKNRTNPFHYKKNWIGTH